MLSYFNKNLIDFFKITVSMLYLTFFNRILIPILNPYFLFVFSIRMEVCNIEEVKE